MMTTAGSRRRYEPFVVLGREVPDLRELGTGNVSVLRRLGGTEFVTAHRSDLIR
jgi:hypothetical protein